MATKAYVVSEGSFSYDDNYYSSQEGGYPSKVFLELEQAEECAEQMGLETFKKLVLEDDIFNYGYGDIDGVFDCSAEFDSFCRDKFKQSSNDWWKNGKGYHPPDEDDEEDNIVEMSEEDWKTLYGFCNIEFAFVNEVGFGDVFS